MTQREIDYDDFFDVQDRLDFLDGNKSYEYDSCDEKMDDEFYESFRIIINPDYKKKDCKQKEEEPDELDMLLIKSREEKKKRKQKNSNKV